jgi:hypothetical protein
MFNRKLTQFRPQEDFLQVSEKNLCPNPSQQEGKLTPCPSMLI